jgi:osmoprotectant transport system permease protein
MSLAVVSEFTDAIRFIFESRESVAGTVQVGGAEFLELTGNHLLVSFTAIAVACAISVPIGLWLGHKGKGEFAAVTVSNVGRAVPSLALIAFFIAYLGVGFVNVAAVLVLLAIPPILTNTYVGVRQVDRDAVDAARGMGMTEAQIVRRVELPMALPIVFGGIRTSSVNVVATATIAPLANVNTLGVPIINENIYGDTGQLAAALVVAVITVLVDAGMGLVQRAITPKGLRVDSVRAGRRGPFLATLRRRPQPT